MAQLIIDLPEGLLFHGLELANQLSADADSGRAGAVDNRASVADAIERIIDHHFHECDCLSLWHGECEARISRNTSKQELQPKQPLDPVQ